MRILPPSLQSALESGASTLARCWQVNRRDGAVLGFTDHDATLEFDGISHEPETGFTPSAIEAGIGLSPDTHDVSGALRSDRITETDIAKGLYDGAEVTLWLTDWRNTDARVVLSRGLVAEIRRGDIAFEAEITGLSDKLNQPVGRAYLHSCSARLGDTDCGVDLTQPAFKGTATVSAVSDPQQLTVTGLAGFAEGWFTGGAVTWLTGANAGLDGHVKTHLAAASASIVELWLAPACAAAPGDTFEITAGCEKTAATCIAKFANLLNFRGFPHMPGDDVAAGYPSSGGTHDGGSLFRS